jgi:hypothetical protein
MPTLRTSASSKEYINSNTDAAGSASCLSTDARYFPPPDSVGRVHTISSINREKPDNAISSDHCFHRVATCADVLQLD